jgi:hypothetical protein
VRARRCQPDAGSAVKVVNAGKVPGIKPDHPDEVVGLGLLMEALGTTSRDFASGLLTQLASAGTVGSQPDEGAINFMLSVIEGIKLRDHVEAMMAAQMAAIHRAMMTFTRRLSGVENIKQQDSAAGALNKLARTFAMQVEALKRYRTGGEQKVTVQHVTISEGGQAIVGNVTHTPAVGGRNRCRMHGGAPGSGAPLGNTNALKQGHYTRAAIAERQRIRALLREAQKLIDSIK